MRRDVFLAALLVILLCAGCTVLGPSDFERALQTRVAEQATQLAEQSQEGGGEPSPTSGLMEKATPALLPTQTAASVAPAPKATPTGVSTATTPAVSATETAFGGDTEPKPEACEIVAEGEVTAYDRPSVDAHVFGHMTPGLRVRAQGRTADGWLGFDPGVAQAPNVGVFRLRWVQESGAVRLEGGCDDLPALVGPPAGVCFTMAMDAVDVHAKPDVSSLVVATMSIGDYAGVVGLTADGWARVDLTPGNTGLSVEGWIEAATLNMNGPCDSLPTVVP